MRILSRYVLGAFLVPLGYCLVGFVSIYVMFELFGSFSRLMEAKLPLGVTMEYFAAYLAPYFEWLAPAALMLATLYTMWNFCRHSEIVAMRASGVSFSAIVRPLLVAALVMAAFVGWVNECYVPRTAQWAKKLRTARFDLAEVDRADNVVYCNVRDDRTWTVSRIDGADGHRLTDVRITVNRPGSGTRLKNVVAARAEWLDGEWWLANPRVQHFDETGREIPSPVPELDALSLRVFPEFRERPSDLLAQNRDWQYNSVRDKRRFIRTHPHLAAEKLREYSYDVWSQLLAPLACLVITLFAIPAGIASGRQSVFRGILGALAMFFAFYALSILCMIAARKGWFPAVPAAVLPHALFLVIGGINFHRQR